MSSPLRELDYRSTDGIDVQLLWDPASDRVHVAVSDAKTGEAFTVRVGHDQRAYDVFHHPYAYAAERTGPLGDLTVTGS
jgi:hypothetical protein